MCSSFSRVRRGALSCLILLSLSNIAGTVFHETIANSTLESTLLELHQNLRDTAHITYYDQNNIHKNMREITLPIKLLGLNLEYVGNYFRNETKVDYSQRALEKACPLLDLLSVEDASGCLQSLDANYRLSETFPDDEAISLQTKKLLDPYQHLKIELWLKTFLQMRQEYNSNYEEVVLMFLKRFTGNEILHRISLISQNLFSELLVDEDENTRLWAEASLDVIHRYVWKSKMALTPPIHVMNQEKRHDMHPPQKNVNLQKVVTSITGNTAISNELSVLSNHFADNVNVVRKPEDLSISTPPNYLPDLIYWQWTVSNPAKIQPPQNIRPPSPAQPIPKTQQLLSAHHRLETTGFDPLAPPIVQPRSAVTTVQANSSALFVLSFFLLILISIIGVLFYSSTLSAPSIRRKPKRTPKKSLIEQIDGYRVGFTYCQRSFWSTFQCPLTLMMESKLFAQRQAEIKKGNISKSGAPTTPRAPYFLKVCEIILSSIWTFFSRFTHKILSKSVSVSEGQSIPENYSLTNSPSLAENTQLQPHQLSEHQHSSPPEISFCLNPIVSQNDSVLVAREDCDCNLNMPLSDIVPADPEPIAAAPPADEPTKACTHIGPLGFPTLPPQLPIRIQTKKERRSEKLKRSSSEQAKPVDTLPLVSVVSEHNPLLPKNPIVSVNESTTKIDQQLAQSPPDEHHSVITQPAPAENEPSAEQSIQSPLLIASPNLLASEVDIGGFDSVNVEDIKPLFDEVLSLPSFPSDSADGVSLLDDDTFDDSQLGQILDESSQQIDTIGPPPGFFEPGPTLSSDPQLPERPSLLADLNETSEVFMATLDAHTLGPLAPLTSASRTVGCSQSPSFFDFSIAPHGSGNNPFFRGDIDWTQPYLDALNNSDTTYQEDEYSEKDFQPLPASLHAPCVDESQWTREDYNGSSYSSSAAGYLSTNYHDSAIAPSFPSYHTMANNLPASRRPTHSYSPHESQVSYQPSYPRTFMPSSRMISEHPRHPNWQYYAQHPSPTLSKSIQQNSPTRQTIKLALTVKVRLLPPPKVAQVKIASLIFGRWSVKEALPMKPSVSTSGLWGISMEIPSDMSRFSYLYVAIDVGGRVWVEPYSPRVLDFGIFNYLNEISQEDTFERGRLQSGRDIIDILYPEASCHVHEQK